MTQKEIALVTAELAKQAEMQQRINEEAGYYQKLIKDIQKLNKDLAQTEKLILTQKEKLNKTIISGSKEEIELEEEKLKIIEDQLVVLKKQTNETIKIVKENRNIKTAFKGVKNDIFSIGKAASSIYSTIKGWGFFEIDKAIKTSATQMGLLSAGTKEFRDTLYKASNITNKFGVSTAELAGIQSTYSDELGRTVMLGDKGLIAISAMGKASGLGSEFMASMAASMENQGFSAERTSEFVEDSLNSSTKLGLNASKVMRNIKDNMKMLNKFNFKGGTKGLMEMAQTVTKLGVSMTSVEGMAEKLFDIEGAVDMSAQLQVMGGAWADLGDPFKLMYMARNDMNGLAKATYAAAESAVTFNSSTGDFEIKSMEMHKLRKIADQLGMSYDELATGAKNARKQTEFKKQIGISFIGDKDAKALENYIATAAEMGKDGKASILVGAEPKLLSQLTNADKNLIRTKIDEKANLAVRAKASQSFDEKITNLINQFKEKFLPIFDKFTPQLEKIANTLAKTLSDPLVFDAIKKVAETAGEVIISIAKFISKNPIGSAIGGLLSFGLFEAGKWALNGVAMGGGFNLATGKFGASIGDALNAPMGKFEGKMGKFEGKIGKSVGIISLGINSIAIAVDAYKNFSNDKLSAGDAFMKTIKDNAFKIGGAVVGGTIGAFAGGPAGAILGAGIGADLGAGFDAVNDGIIRSPIHDGKIGAGLGADFSKNRGIIQGGKITPIDNRDDLLAMKPNGIVDKHLKNNSGSNKIKVDFGEIRFKFDDLKVVNANGQNVSVDLLNNPMFIRSLTQMIHTETDKLIQGGKVKG